MADELKAEYWEVSAKKGASSPLVQLSIVPEEACMVTG
jgi:hypothetical protein